MRRAENVQSGRKEVAARGGERTERDDARVTARQSTEVGLDGSDLVDDLPGVAHDLFTGRCQRHGATAPWPIEQPSAGSALERRYLQADRGLAVAELGTGGDEGPRLNDCVQRREMTDLDAEPSLRFAHRVHEKDKFAQSRCGRDAGSVPPRLPALLAAPPGTPTPLWLTGASVFDGTGSPTRCGVSVLVENGRIAALASAGDAPPERATIVELAGRTLLPGLIDAHVHVKADFPVPDPGAEPLLNGATPHFVAADLRETLRRGITTVRDVGSYGELVFAARQAMRYGAFRGPRLLTCGQIISATAPGGRFFPGMYREADGPSEIRKAVREQLRRGADFIKVMTTGARSVELEDPDPAQLSREEIMVLVSEAHRQGYRTAAHCEGLAGTELAITEGIDTIEHGMYLHQRPDLLERMAANDQTLVPTLSCFYGVAGREHAIGFDAAEIAAGTPSPAPYMPRQNHAVPCWTPLLVELAQHNLRQADLTLRAARSAGVHIAAGHDWHPSWDHALEIRRMIAHGLTAGEALSASTQGGAQALGIGSHVGTIEVGKLADLVAVDGDPLTDPALLSDRRQIWLVLQAGVTVAGSALERAPAVVSSSTPPTPPRSPSAAPGS
jgi:imidazolonepropionase-like amidohydrolase